MDWLVILAGEVLVVKGRNGPMDFRPLRSR